MAHLMPLPLTVSCFSKIQTGITFLVLAHLGNPGKRAIKPVCIDSVAFIDVNVFEQQACKRAAAAATQLVNSSSVAAKSNSNAASQSQMSAETRTVCDETIPHIVQALRAAALLSPNDDPTPAQMALVSAAQEMIQVHLLAVLAYREDGTLFCKVFFMFYVF